MRPKFWLTATFVLITGTLVTFLVIDQSRTNKTAPATQPRARRILYYRSPMNAAIHSPVPTKDNMGMAFLPVYAHRAGTHPRTGFTVDHRLRQSYGVRTVVVGTGASSVTLTAPGIIAVDRHDLMTINPRVDGWLSRLQPDTIGDLVHRGTVIGRLYAPALRAAESDYLMLQRTHAGPRLRQAVTQRLARLGLGPQGRAALARRQRVPATMPLYAPINGVVVKIGATAGQYVTPATAIITIAPLSPVWVQLALPPTAADGIRVGDAVVIQVPGGLPATGTVRYIYPTIDPQERTLTVRVRLANPDGHLRPGLYVRARIHIAAHTPMLTIPRTAVLHTGTGISYVFVATGQGHFQLQRVTLGAASGRTVVVQKGLRKGAHVVVHGLFLLDADSHIHGVAVRMSGSESDHD
ncbi:MAG: efflux RND transporter periplasmic adaptor subunit [Acidiferrobacter sp.]